MPASLNAERKQGVLNVCIRSFVITLAAGMSLVAATAQAQGTAQQAAGTQSAASQTRTVPIAVIDLGYILRNHPTMKQQIEQIKAETETIGAAFEKKRQGILKQMEELRENYTEGSAEYAEKERQIAEADTTFRLEVVRKNKEFDEARAQIFFQVHQQVTRLVQFYCQHKGTFVVLKVAREKPDPKKPETIEIAMGQEVFFHQDAPDVDITEWVLGQLKQQAAQPTQAQGATNTATRPAAGAVTR